MPRIPRPTAGWAWDFTLQKNTRTCWEGRFTWRANWVRAQLSRCGCLAICKVRLVPRSNCRFRWKVKRPAVALPKVLSTSDVKSLVEINAHLARNVRKGAIVAPQIHFHPKIVNIIRSKHIDLPLSLRCFDDNADRKILPGDTEKSFTSLPNHRSHGSQQLGEAVPVGDGSLPAAVIPAFIFHARDIPERISIAFRRQG